MNTLAWIYVVGPHDIRKPERALELARQAVEDEPNNTAYLNTLGVAYYRTGAFEKAIETLQKSAQLAEDEPSAFDLFILAMSHHRLGATDEARKFYDQAIAWWRSQSNLPQDSLRELEAIRDEADMFFGGVNGAEED